MECCWAQQDNGLPSLIKVLTSISGPMDECSVSQGSDCIRKCLSRVCNSLLQMLLSFSRMIYFVLFPLEANTSTVVRRFQWNEIFLRWTFGGKIYLMERSKTILKTPSFNISLWSLTHLSKTTALMVLASTSHQLNLKWHLNLEQCFNSFWAPRSKTIQQALTRAVKNEEPGSSDVIRPQKWIRA